MSEMSGWEIVLLGGMVAMLLFYIGPRLKGQLAASKQATNKDWQGFLIPIAVVVVFVVLLMVAV